MKVKYSQIVRRKIKALKKRLTAEFGREASDKVIIIEMFDEQEDFMYQLFGISSISQESEDFWGE